jgi:hypothetical protein
MAVTYTSSYQFGVQNSTVSVVHGEYSEYEFIGSASGIVDILKDGVPVFVDHTRILLFVLGRKWPSSWRSIEDGQEGTRIILLEGRVFPNGADCCVGFYSVLASVS